MSDELAGYLEKIFQLAQDSDGAFDPTIGKIIRLWDIAGENPHVPEQSELDELLKDVGYGKVSLDGDKVTLEKGATLDLGATGKGIGCDVVSDWLMVRNRMVPTGKWRSPIRVIRRGITSARSH